MAARNGEIEVLEWLSNEKEGRNILPNKWGAIGAARKGYNNILEWMKKRGIIPT